MIKDKLIKLANYLDRIGLNKEADFLDIIIKRATPIGDISEVDEEKAEQMGKLEEIYFGPHGRAESPEGMLDDLNYREDVTGVIYTGDRPEDEGEIQGYLYGFKFDLGEHYIDLDGFECFDPECEGGGWKSEKDDWDDEDWDDEDWDDEDEDKFGKIMEENEKLDKILYVTNFLVDRKYRHKVIEVITAFIEKVKASNYEYIVFDAMPKTLNLVMKDGRPNPDREKRFGLKVIGKTYNNAFLVRVDKAIEKNIASKRNYRMIKRNSFVI